MKFCAKPPFRRNPPGTPVMFELRLKKSARAPTFPSAMKFLVLAYNRNACEPVSAVPLTIPAPGTFRFLSIWSNSGWFPPARVMLNASKN